MTEHKFIDSIEYKQCSCCKEFKTLDQFQKRKDSKDGYRDKCISCLNVVKQAWLNRSFENVTHKVCNKCGIDKPILEYTKSSNSVDGYAYTCRECTKLYRQQNIEHIQQYNLIRLSKLSRVAALRNMKILFDQQILNESDFCNYSQSELIDYYNTNSATLREKQKQYYKEQQRIRRQNKYYQNKIVQEQQKEKQRLELYEQGLKTCYVCKQNKPLSSFNKRSVTIDGLDSTCIECRNKKLTERKANRIVVNEGFKTCTCCGKVLPVSEFRLALSCLDGRGGQCKNCEKEKQKAYIENLTSEQKEQRKQYHKNYVAKNKEHIQEYQKQYKIVNAEKIKQSDKERYNKNKLNKSMSCWLRTALKENKAERHWEDLVSYNLQQLKEHLESQFTSEMNWDNYGSYWEIDHVIPQNTFSFETENDVDFKICWSLINLRPLEKSANRQRPKDGSDISEELKQQILNQFR